MGMTMSGGVETMLLMLLGAAVVFLAARVAARVYRDKPEVWRSQAFLSGRQAMGGRAMNGER